MSRPTIIYLHSAATSLDWVNRPVIGFARYADRPNVDLPLTTGRCYLCNGPVEPADVDHVSRVDGNSCNGYEPVHVECSGRLDRELSEWLTVAGPVEPADVPGPVAVLSADVEPDRPCNCHGCLTGEYGWLRDDRDVDGRGRRHVEPGPYVPDHGRTCQDLNRARPGTGCVCM